MLILTLEPPNHGQQGDHVYRTAQPSRALGSLPGVTTVSGSWLSRCIRELALEADVLVLLEVVEPDLLPLIRERQRLNKVTVYEINDDFLDIQDWNPTAGFFARPESRSLIFQLANKSDALQFTTEDLRRRYGSLNLRGAVFANQLHSVPPLPQRQGGPVRIGWAGSYGHLEDVRAMQAPLKRVLSRHPDCVFSMMGDPRIAALFDWLPKERFEARPPGTLEDYVAFVSTLDIGLAPLLDTGFNRGRSDVKFLEYAAAGAVAVCTRSPAYERSVRHGKNGFLVDALAQMEGVLEQLLQDPSLRQRVRQTAHREVASDRLEQEHAPRRAAYYRELLEHSARGPARTSTPLTPWLERIARRPQTTAFPDSDYLRVDFGAVEAHLYNGLCARQDAAQARADFMRAVDAEPDSYLAHLYLAGATGNGEALKHLERAAELGEYSVAARMALAGRYERQGEHRRAATLLEAVLDLAPDYAPAWAQLGALAQGLGQGPEAVRCFRRALRENPRYRPPARALTLLLLKEGALPQAMALARESVALGEATALERRLLRGVA